MTVSIRQGDSIGLIYGLGAESLAAWTCEVAVKTHAGQATPTYELTLTDLADDDTRYTGTITRTVTAAWDARRYIIVCDLYNSATGEAKEFETELLVLPQGYVKA